MLCLTRVMVDEQQWYYVGEQVEIFFCAKLELVKIFASTLVLRILCNFVCSPSNTSCITIRLFEYGI